MEYVTLAKDCNTLRQDHVNYLISSREASVNTRDGKDINALKVIHEAEQQQSMFRCIKRVFKPLRSNSVSRVDIPSDLIPHSSKDTNPEGNVTTSDQDLTQILQRTICTKRQDGTEEWTTVIDQTQVETAILMYSHQHFQQARSTPFGHGVLADLIGHSGLTKASQAILDGTLFENYDLDLFQKSASSY